MENFHQKVYLNHHLILKLVFPFIIISQIIFLNKLIFYINFNKIKIIYSINKYFYNYIFYKL